MDKSQPNTLYGTTEDRMNTFANISNVADVRRVFKAVQLECPVCPPDTAIKHMQDLYGVRLRWVDTPTAQGWGLDFEIVDPKLYTLFLLKYS